MSLEAMKQALEALEDANGMAYSEFSSENLYGEEITALRQAIANEALNKKAENARELGLDYEPSEQEPVAWLNENEGVDAYALSWYKNSMHTIPLYTHPQPKAGAEACRTPLTDTLLEVLHQIDMTGIRYNETPVEAVGRIRALACAAIEAAHGIKGETK